MRILIVEDDASIRDSCSSVLREAGHAVEACASGEEALGRLPDGWDVLLAGLVLPGAVGGGELVRRARAATSADAIVLAGPSGAAEGIEALRGGAYDCLIKPFAPELLAAAVRRCGEKRRLSQELSREKILRAEIERAHYEAADMEKAKEMFGQFATPEIAKLIQLHPHDFWKRGERKIVTVLFADVRSFTPFASRVPPEEVVWALNDIFARVIAQIQKEGGILNKFIGDGMMALFGAPVADVDHARAGARAALRARDAVEELAASRKKLDLEPLRIGLGLNTGEVVAGCLGTKDRAEYSVIGHAVNLAARLEESAEPGQVLIGPETAKALGAAFETRDLGPRSFSGMAVPVAVKELIAERPRA